MCWRSVPGVYLKMILWCIEDPFQCSELEGVARARTARSGIVEDAAAVRVRGWDR